MAANYVTIKSGAASPVVPFAFTDENGNPLDLSAPDVIVTFKMRLWNSSVYVINGQAAVILTPMNQGSGYYALNDTDTAIPGHYLGEWTINPGNLIMPSDGYIHILIGPSL